MGIRVIAVTDANFKPEKQVSDIETVLAKKPNIIISIPTDPVATAAAYRKAGRQGVKLVFMDNVPNGLRPRQGLRQRRLGRQLRQRRRLGASDGRALEREGQDRHRLPRGRLLRHQAALHGLQEDDREADYPGHQDRRRSRGSPARTSPATRRRPRRRMLTKNADLDGDLGGVGRPGRGRARRRARQRAQRPRRHHRRPRPERRDRHGQGRAGQGPRRPAPVRPRRRPRRSSRATGSSARRRRRTSR